MLNYSILIKYIINKKMKESEDDSSSQNSSKSEEGSVKKLDDSNQDIKNSSIEASLISNNPTKIIPGSNSNSQEFQIESNESNKSQKIESNNDIIDEKKNNIEESKEKITTENISQNELEKNKENQENNITKINNENLKIISNNIEEYDKPKKKDIICVEVDKEKTQQKNHTVFQISISNNTNNFISGVPLNANTEEKKILCYRRYKDFDKFYNTLKIRYPHFIFPRLSEKTNLVKNNKFFSDPEFIENRRKELQYFMNQLYLHEELGNTEEFKKFLFNSIFDEDYYSQLPPKFSYPECEKASTDKGYLSQGVQKISSFFGGFVSKPNKEYTQGENEKKILKREDEFKNKSIQYSKLLSEIKIIKENSEKELNTYNIISNNLLYLRETNNNKDIDNNKKKFNELININKNFSEVLSINSKFFNEEILEPLSYCILEIDGVNRALERYENFIKTYQMVINTNSSASKFIEEEKLKVKNDKEIFESSLSKDIQKFDLKNQKVYQKIIEKITFYLKKINQNNLEIYQKSNFISN